MPDALGNRMKMYEAVADSRLAPRIPVIARVDGRAFHTLTRGMDRPFDHRVVRCMTDAAADLFGQIQGCRFAYIQSDEINLLITDWDRFSTECWFKYRVQKVVSVAAAVATEAFGRALRREFKDTPFEALRPVFDARAANYPRHEVVNYFVWRQQDWVRNSVHMLARSVFSAKQLHRVSSGAAKKMLLEEGHPWDDLPDHLRKGTCIYNDEDGKVVIDTNPPIFMRTRGYVERHMPEVFWREDEEG